MPGLYDATAEELADLLSDQPGYRVRQVWDALYRQARLPEEMTALPVDLRRRLAADLAPPLEEAARQTCDDGRTVKWLWRLHDGATVETVSMTYPDRVTVCVSSQAGCAMACSFCATGQAGYTRQLTEGEIVGQVLAARRSSPARLSHVVFMGMGEPMANYGPVVGSLRRLTADLGLSARHLTVSTVGIVPGIRRLAAEGIPVNLAVSLHSADDERRNDLVPVNRRYPLAVLAEACGEYLARTGRRLTFEWALIDGVNDTDTDVDQLAAYARDLRAHVNLIPLNPTPGYPVRGTPPGRVRAFAAALRHAGVNATVRDTRGREIDAACGQLAAATPAPVHLRGTTAEAGAVDAAGAADGTDGDG